MGRGQLREKLAKALRQDAIPDPVWAELEHDGYVAAAVNGREGWEDLKSVAAPLMRVHRAAANGSVAPRTPPTVREEATLSPAETAHSDALSEYLAAEASAMPAVGRFRRDVLGGRTISLHEVGPLLRSPAAAFFSADWFHQRGIPIVGHRADVVDRKSETIDEDRHVTRVTLTVDVGWEGGFVTETGVTDIANNITTNALKSGRPRVTTPRDLILQFPFEIQGERRAFVFPGSVLHALSVLSTNVAGTYPWTRAEATWVILTGETTWVSPLVYTYSQTNGTSLDTTSITLTVRPWVSANTVAKFYRYARRQAESANSRPARTRAAALLQFVARERRSGAHPPWRATMARWNDAHPEARYQDVRHFAQAFRRAERAVGHCGVSAPWPLPNPYGIGP